MTRRRRRAVVPALAPMGALVALLLSTPGCGARSALSVEQEPDAAIGTPPVGPRPTRFVDVAAGRTHSCAVTDIGTVYCWGSNRRLELGIGETERATFPPTRVPGIDDAVRVSADAGTCVVRLDGHVACWGSGESYLFGPDVEMNVGEPTTIEGLERVTDVSVGNGHACAKDARRRVWSWGINSCGQLGHGEPSREWFEPAEVPGLDPVARVSAGSCHTCAVTSDERVFCWGSNGLGQLGVPDVEGARPRHVLGAAPATDVEACSACTCAVGRGGTQCWGSGIYGALGQGDTRGRPEPADVDGPGPAVSVGTGCATTCSAYEDGSVWCWGSASFGSISAGIIEVQLSPVLQPDVRNAVVIAAGLEHTCALLESGEVQCWGRGQHAQLGDGSEEHHGVLTTLRAADL